jgi:hypothetical protein
MLHNSFYFLCSFSTTVNEVKNYSFQSCPEHRINCMDDFQIHSSLNINSPKFNNIPSPAHDKSTCRTKSSTSGCKLRKASISMDGMFLDSDLFPDCITYTKSKEPSRSITMEQRSGTDLDIHANGEEKHDVFNFPECEPPKGTKSSYVGGVGLGMEDKHCESREQNCESEKFSDEAENFEHTEAGKCSFEESHLVFEACANGTP